MLPLLAEQTRATPFSPFRPEFESGLLPSSRVDELTASHFRALNAFDRVVAGFTVHVHTETNAIALVLAVDKDTGDDGVGIGKTQQGQSGQSRGSRSMHFRFVGRSFLNKESQLVSDEDELQ